MSLYNSHVGCEKLRKIIARDGVKIHFIGICGSGMLPLARLMHSRGAMISGTDASVPTEGIQELAVIAPLSSCDADIAVYSLAIGDRHPDVVYAREAGIPLVSRAELLGAVAEGYRRTIAVAGTHGKSTTTAMIHSILLAAGVAPTTVCGAKLPSGESLFIGNDDLILIEACEYKDSFLHIDPSLAAITNVELDHVDYFDSEERLVESFSRFARSASCGTVVWDDGGAAARIARECGGVLVGFGDGCDYRVADVLLRDDGASFSLMIADRTVARLKLRVYGMHNVANAALAAVVGMLYGVCREDVERGLASFCGIERRCELIGYIGKRAVIYDYAHHPTEMRCTLETLNARFGSVTCIFRPHTYTRTAAFFDGFVEALSIADRSVLLDIFPAREKPIPGITSEKMAKAVGDRCVHLDFADVVNYCLQNTSGAIALMGAGNVDSIKAELDRLIDAPACE